MTTEEGREQPPHLDPCLPSRMTECNMKHNKRLYGAGSVEQRKDVSQSVCNDFFSPCTQITEQKLVLKSPEWSAAPAMKPK